MSLGKIHNPGIYRVVLPGCEKVVMWRVRFSAFSRLGNGGSMADLGTVEGERGVRWACKAVTVLGEPRICFLASERSASNGVSSTKIRKMMLETSEGKLYEELKDHVLCPDLLVEWLLENRGREVRVEDDDCLI